MPMSPGFQTRLTPILKDVANHYKTPFHIYDEKGIRETGALFKKAFSGIDGFREFYAVKALPNVSVLSIMKDMGFGFDASSTAEVLLSRMTGAGPMDIMFTSNNTSDEEFAVAMADGGAIINLDDISFLDKLKTIPELICFRYNPGNKRTGNDIIGVPVKAKYGLSDDQIVAAYDKAKKLGATRFGLHTMLASNELNYTYMVETAKMLLELMERIHESTGIAFEFINIGGGFGIPYRPDVPALDIMAMGREITDLFTAFKNKNGYAPRLFTESGRYVTGPHGALVTTAINHKDIYRYYVGVDACMSSLMRPGMYGAYHHITVHGKTADKNGTRVVDVVGALCENNDKFAEERMLPVIEEGDLLVIHDTGAHGHAMGFNYNGRLRPKELLLKEDGSVELIRREETLKDHFATLTFEADVFKP